MRDDEFLQKVFTRRYALLFGGQLLVAAGLAARVHKLQVISSPDLRRIAEENRVSLHPIAPRRSNILDRHGSLIATVRSEYSVKLNRQKNSDDADPLRQLVLLRAIPEDHYIKILSSIRDKPGRKVFPVIESADWKTVARISANAPSLPGIEIEESWIREYPEGEAFAHTVGYVGPISEQDLNRDPLLVPLRSMPQLRIGKRGVEKTQDKQLRGRPGVVTTEINALGRKVRELRRNPPRSGEDIVLTLDRHLQRYAIQRLAGNVGAAIVMDVRTGGILCMVSSPGFDPNWFAGGISRPQWNELLNHPNTPLLDRAMDGEYAPGSTFKLVVSLAALEAGVRLPHYRTTCTGMTELGNQQFHCWKKYGHGSLAIREAIKESCDIYFYWTADELGIDRIVEMAHRMGLGERYSFGVPHSRAGLVPTRDWKRAETGRGWRRGDSFNAGIGQGFMLATPIQLAVMTARVANGRLRIQPRIVMSPGFDAEKETEPLGIGESSLKVLRDALFAVCNEERGTGYASRISLPDATLAGKTGTSQVRRITAELRRRGLPDQENIPWKLRNHAMFVGYAPSDLPRYAIAVVIEHGGSGASGAAPVARDLIIHALKNRPPTPADYPNSEPDVEEREA